MEQEKQVELEQDNQVKPRKPFVAGLLSVLIPGLGQLYNGQWKKGVLFALVEVLLGIFVVFGLGRFSTMVLGIVALLAFIVFILADAAMTARKQREYRLKLCNRGQAYALFILASLGLGTAVDMVGMDKLYKSYKSPSGSMLQTIQIDDHFMTEILDEAATIKRGDILIFENPKDPAKDYVKRVVALPGETVAIVDKEVFINGEPLAESYAYHTKEDTQPVRDNFDFLTLGPDEYFMLGDNREASFDSRWLGPIKRAAIKARALYFYFPAESEGLGWIRRFGAPVR